MREDVGNGGEEGDAGGEEVEGGHASDAAFSGAHGLGGEDEGAEADAAGGEAGEEAEEEVGGEVGGEGGEAAKDGVEEADYGERTFSSKEGI